MFEFISNTGFRKILNRDYDELEKCVNVGASKAVVVISGSIIEAILIEYFINNLPLGKTKEQVMGLKLVQLINLAEQTGLISRKIKELSSVVRDYRNYIHPAKEIRMNEFIDQETATITFSLLKIIIKEVENKYSKLYGHTAEKLFNKILTDNSVFSIFNKLINKTSKVELERLGVLLTNYYLENYPSNEEDIRGFTIRYINVLKPKLDNHFIKSQLIRLKDEVQHGEKDKALMFFDLYGEKLILLDQDSIDLIIDYIYSVVGQCGLYSPDNLTRHRVTNLYENLKIYNTQERNKKKFFSIIVSIVRFIKFKKRTRIWLYIDIYKTLVSHIEPIKLSHYLLEKVGKETYDTFQEILNEEEEIPF